MFVTPLLMTCGPHGRPQDLGGKWRPAPKPASQRLLAPSAGAVGESGGGHAHQVLRRLTAGEASRQAQVDAALVARAEKRERE